MSLLLKAVYTKRTQKQNINDKIFASNFMEEKISAESLILSDSIERRDIAEDIFSDLAFPTAATFYIPWLYRCIQDTGTDF